MSVLEYKNICSDAVLKWIYDISEINMYSCCTIQVTGVHASYRTQRNLSNTAVLITDLHFNTVIFHVLFRSDDHAGI